MNRIKSENTTILDIAKKANVSIATVSRAINPDTRHKVAPETLEQIDALVKKFIYTPNLAAKNMRATRLKTVGFLVPHFPNIFLSEYHSKVFSGVSNVLMDSDYRLKLILMKRHQPKWDGHLFKSSEGVDGLVMESWPELFSKKLQIDVPSVVISDPEENTSVHFVAVDNVHGGELAAKRLYESGHERIAVLMGHEWSSDSWLRLKGFKQWMHRVGTAVPQEMIYRANYEEEDAAKIVDQIFLQKKKVTAFFCCNDNMALGVLRKLKQLNIRCPQQISVIGFDDESRGRYSDPALTTIHMPTQELGQTAAKILLDHLKENSPEKALRGTTLLPVSLVERKSVGPAS